MRPEEQVETFLKERVLRAGGRTYKVIPSTAGLPDRLVVFPGGRIHLVELKQKDGEVSPIQHHRHEELASLGVQVVVLWSISQVAAWVATQAGQVAPPN